MADPIVGITNGVPTSGTGNITTLGQTLIDGANIAVGATTDLAVAAGAIGSLNAKLRAISRDIAGGVVLQAGGNVIGAVTQSGGPWSVSGTVAATQSGAWNVGNITGTVSLPTGAATAALQPSNAAIASATSGQTGNLAMGAVTTGAPAYTTGTSNVLSLTTVGALRVDGSAVTQPVSGTVAISGTVAVTESGTWTVQPGNTANTTPWLMTVNQGGNSATVSATGALKVDGSAVTQPISAASLPLPSGAATAALQPSNAAQGSTTTGQTGPLVQAAVTTAAPTYTTGQTSPLSLTTAGALRVDGSGVTQTVNGTVTANQGGAWNQRLQDGLGNAITSDARGTARPLAVEILDASGNQITSFGAGSGPSFGSAFPTTGSAIGMKDSAGVNMVAFNANAAGALKVDGSATTQPVSGTFWQTTQPVSGTFWQATQPISAASLPLPAGAATSANQATAAAIGSTTSGQTGGLAFGAVTTGLPAYTTAQSNPLSLTTTGLLRVDGSNVTQPISGNVGITGTVAATQSGTWNITNISGTVSLPTGAATSANQPTNAALGSTTTGQTGHLSLGAVTTAAPSYTSGQSNALSLTTTGALRTDASATTQPVSGTVTASQGGTWTMQPGNTANTTPWLATINQGGNSAAVTASSALKVDGSAVTQPVSGTITANQGGNWTSRVVGNAGGILDFAGQNVATPANALLVGAQFNTTPTTVVSGNASPLQIDSAGNLKVNVAAGGASGGTSSSFAAAFPGTGTAAGAEYLSTPPSLVSGNMAALQVDSSGNLKVNIQSGGGTGGTASSFNATFPATGTAAGGEYLSTPPTLTTGQMVALQTDVNGNLKVNIAAGAGGGGTSSTVGAATPTTGTLGLGAVTTSAPSYTTATANSLSLNTSGGLRVDGSGVNQPITLHDGNGNSIISLSSALSTSIASVQGNSTIYGSWNSTYGVNSVFTLPGSTNNTYTTVYGQLTQTSTITGGAVTFEESFDANVTFKPIPAGRLIDPATGLLLPNPYTFVANTNQAFQIITSGAQYLRLRLSTVITGTGSVSVNSGHEQLASTIQAFSPSAAGFNATVTGGTAQNAAAPANELVVGGVYNSTAPTLTSGNASQLQLDASGNLNVNVKAGGAGGGGTSSNFAAAFPTAGTAIGAKDSAGVNMQPMNLDASGNLRVSSPATVVSGSSWGSGSTLNSTLAITSNPSVNGQITTTTTILGGAITFEESFDSGTSWFSLPTNRLINPATNQQLANPYTLSANTNQPFEIVSSGTTQLRVRLSTVITGTGNAIFTFTTSPLPTTMQVFSGAAANFNTNTNLHDGSGNSINSSLGNLNTNQVSVSSTNVSSGAWSSATGVNTTFNLVSGTLNTYLTITGQITQTANVTGGTLLFEESYDGGTTYQTIPRARLYDPVAGQPMFNPYSFIASTNQAYQIITAGAQYVRVRLYTVITGTGTVTVGANLQQTPSTMQVFGPVLTNTQGAVTASTAPSNMTVIGGVHQSTPPTVGTSQSVALQVDTAGNLMIGGDTASGVTDANNPIKIGGLAKTANPAAVTDGQRVAGVFDKQGKQIVVGAIRQLKGVQKTSILTATETTVVTAGAANVFQDVYAITVTNKSATAVFVDFRDATAGTIRMTLAAPAGDTRGFTVPVDSAMVQAVAANNWTATVSSAVTSIEITMLYVSNL